MTSDDRHRDRDVTAQTLEALLHAITNRLTEVTIAKVKGRQGRKGTRHWTPPAGQPMSTKALDPTSVVDPEQWRAQVEQAAWQVLGPAGVAAGNKLRQKLRAGGVQPGTTQTIPPEQPPLNQVKPPSPPAQGGDGAEAHPLLDYAIYRAVRWLGDAGASKATELRAKIAAAEQADIDARTANAVEEVRQRALNEGSSVEPIVTAIRDWQHGPDGSTGLGSWSRTRAEAATTATIQGVHHGLLTNLPPNVTATRTWRTRGDTRVREFHRQAEGQTVEAGEPFLVGGERLPYPGYPGGRPDNVINCRCHAPYKITVHAEAKDLVRTPEGAAHYGVPIGSVIEVHRKPTQARPFSLPENVDAVGWGYDSTESIEAARAVILGGLGDRDEHGHRGESGHDEAPGQHHVVPSQDEAVQAKQEVAAALAARMTDVPDEMMVGPDYQHATNPDIVWRRNAGDGEWSPDFHTDASALTSPDLTPAQRETVAKAEDIDVGGPRMVRRLREAMAQDLVHQWAETSNDHSPWSLAVQQIIGTEFGIEDAHTWDVDEALQQGTDDLIERQGVMLRSFVHAQYALTQERLAQHGVDTLNLYRGMSWESPDEIPDWARELKDGVTDSVEVPLRPASSFTANGETAVQFSGGMDGELDDEFEYGPVSLVVAAEVPRERILATPRTGVGCLGEWEFVVLGGTGTFSVVAQGLHQDGEEPLSDHDLGWLPVGSLTDEDVLRALTLKPDAKRKRELLKRADDLGIQLKALPTGDGRPEADVRTSGPTPADVRNEDWLRTRSWDVRDWNAKPVTTLPVLAKRLGVDEDGAKEWLRTMPAGEAAPKSLRRDAGLKGGGEVKGMDFDEEIKAAGTLEHEVWTAEEAAKHPRGVHGRFAHTWLHIMHSHTTRDRHAVVADVLAGHAGTADEAPHVSWRKHLDGQVSEDGRYYIERRIAGNRLYVKADAGDEAAEKLEDAPFPHGRLLATGSMSELHAKADEHEAQVVHSDEGGRSDEPAVRSDSASQLGEGRAGSGGAAQGSGRVLPGPGSGSGSSGAGSGGRESGTEGRDVHAAGTPAEHGGGAGGGDRGAGAADAAATADRGPGPGERGAGAGGRESGADGGAERLSGRSGGVGSDDTGGDDLVTEDDQPAPDPQAVPVAPGGEDFRPEGMDDLAPAGKAAKLKANLEALRTLRTLQAEKRAATPEEQATLAKWAGWGGLPEVFDPRKPEYEKYHAEIEQLLSPAEIREARRNTLNAHYTDARVVENVWRAVGELGFDGGRVLEPGSGSGTFIGFAPEHAAMVGVELDSTTAAISQYLYPSAVIRNESFADTNVPDGSFDATVGNVPFGNFALTDREHNPTGESIHNHFILKSLALTRPGGIVAVLTSRYTLDSEGERARRLMADRADLIGAVRLPSGSHQRASGTDVIEDVLIFRVREPGEPRGDESWVHATKRDLDGQTISVNDYWTQHPDYVLGDMHAEKGRFGTGDLIVRGDRDMAALPVTMDKIVASAKREGLTATPSEREALPELIGADRSRHEGHLRAEDDGTFTQARGGASTPYAVPGAQADEMRDLIGLRDNLSSLLAAEAATNDDTPQIEALRAALNARYDAYVEKYGPINRFKLGAKGQRIRPAAPRSFRSDPMSAIVRALEEFDPVSQDAKKADVFTKRAVAPRELRTSADTPQDALTLSMEQYGDVNLPAIAKMLGTDEPTARERLGDLVFEQPPLTPEEQAAAEAALTAERLGDLAAADAVDLTSVGESVREAGKLEPAVAYLSGNVRRKLAAARAAATHDPRFRANVEALERVIPADLGPEEIDGRIGASWIGPDTIEAFMRDILREPSYDYRPNKKVQVAHSGGSIWTVIGPRQGILATQEWGTPDRPAPELIQNLLEQRSIQVTHEVRDPVTGKSRNVPDLEATLAAQEKAQQLQERFAEWIWEDPNRARRLQAVYNDRFNAIVLRKYEATPDRVFPGMSPDWHPFGHVEAAADRIVQEPTVLLAHVVGAGKTSEMAMGAKELRRLGLARKPAIVIPNHMLEQFSREFLQIYPQAKILAAGTEDLQGDKRREFVARAATGDWDAVILTQSAFNAIPMSPEQTEAYIDREMAMMREQLDQARAVEDASKAQERTVKKMETALLRAEEALKKKLGKNKDAGVSFEQTGIDYLMVDEAHMYSNLRVLSNVRGAGNVGSDRATDLHMKIEYLRANTTSGRVATFATGTPIRNTVTQAYVMQRFLRPDLLEEAGIHTFDQWAGTFGEVVSEMELKPEGSGFRQTERFARFRNVPEFLRLFHTFADVKMAEDLDLPTPALKGNQVQTVTVPASDELRAYVAELGERADDVRGGKVAPEEDNMLKISGDGRKAALSMRLVGQDHQPGKIEAAADRIASIHKANADRQYGDDDRPGALQIVFLDMGTPKSGGGDAKDDEDVDAAGSLDDAASVADWDAYNTLKDELVARGLDADSIRFIHEAKNDAQKAEMFAAARNGRISVIVGSSEKMGVGTNIQKRAVALHHLDAPWRPADVEQRDGRIMRQGNLNPDIEIVRYVTEHSFDAYMWQTLERKAKFIHQVMRGKLDVREIEDIGDTAMSYAEVKALATGNPDLLAKAKADTDLMKLTRLERAHARSQTNMRAELKRYEQAIPIWTADADAYDNAIDKRVDTRGDKFAMRVAGDTFTERPDAAAALVEEMESVVRQANWNDREPHVIGQLGGHTITATLGWERNSRVLQVGFAGVPGDPIVSVPTHAIGELESGVVRRLESALAGFEAKRDRLREAIAKGQDEVGRIEDRLGKPFGRAGELVTLRAEVERLAEKMKEMAQPAA
jgi:N12 class adenine-specific DNA methylase